MLDDGQTPATAGDDVVDQVDQQGDVHRGPAILVTGHVMDLDADETVGRTPAPPLAQLR